MNKQVLVWLAMAGLTAVDIGKLAVEFVDLEEVVTASRKQLVFSGLSEIKVNKLIGYRDKISVIEAKQQLNQLEVSAITTFETTYPDKLKQIASAPYVLFVRGNLDIFNKPSLAVVGTRKPSSYGKQVTEKLVRELVASDLVIVSGLAYGIDAYAHRQTLEDGGVTIAVLGNGIDAIQPRAHTSLGRKLLEKGAIVSEYPPGMPGLIQNFPARNRLVAGMTLGTVVVEGAENSGSLITARFAKQFKRPVFAVPGMITNPMSLGPHTLIQNGAVLLRNVTDIHNKLFSKNVSGLTQQDLSSIVFDTKEKQVVIELLKVEPRTTDELLRLSGIDINQISSTITELELEGYVQRDQNKLFLK